MIAVRREFGSSIHLRELKGILYVIQDYIRDRDGHPLPPLSRNSKRSFPLLIKYIEEHFDIVAPIFCRITLLNAKMERVIRPDAPWLRVERKPE
jgi:hypothetical protein